MTAGMRRFGLDLIHRTQLKVRKDLKYSNFMMVDSPGMIDSPGMYQVCIDCPQSHWKAQSGLILVIHRMVEGKPARMIEDMILKGSHAGWHSVLM